jgi:nucleoredoxin
MATLENIFGTVQNKSGETVDLVKHFSGKTVIIYVGLNSDEDCKSYNPVLVEYYNKYHQAKNFDIVFASWNPVQSDIDEAYEGMPWLILPIDSLKIKMVSL